MLVAHLISYTCILQWSIVHESSRPSNRGMSVRSQTLACVHARIMANQTKEFTRFETQCGVFIGVCVPTWSGPMSPCSAAGGHGHVGSGVWGRRPGWALTHACAGSGAWSCCWICGTQPHSLISGTQASLLWGLGACPHGSHHLLKVYWEQKPPAPWFRKSWKHFLNH